MLTKVSYKQIFNKVLYIKEEHRNKTILGPVLIKFSIG